MAQRHEIGNVEAYMALHRDVTSNLVSWWFRTVTVSGRNAITVAHKRSYPLPVLSCDPERKHVWYFNRRRSHMVVSFISHPTHLATQSAWGTTPCQYACLEEGLVVVWGRFRSAGTWACTDDGVQNAEGCFLCRMYLVPAWLGLLLSVFPVIKCQN